MNFLDEPVSLAGFQLVKAFAACLTHLPEDQQVPKESFNAWSTALAETGANEAQIRQVGQWYAMHHQTAPALPYIISAAEDLVKGVALPPHRIAGEIERNAMAILHAVQHLGLSSDDCAQAIILAGTLAHLSMFRRRYPNIDREYMRDEAVGLARQSDFFADEILDEIASGKGELKSLGPYLLHLDTAHQGAK